MSPAEKAAKKLGVRLVQTTPVVGAFWFERVIGRRRVAAAMVYAKTTAKAWGSALKTFRSIETGRGNQ